MDKLIGYVINNKKQITGKVSVAEKVPVHDKYPDYEGTYVVEPKTSEQVLPTKETSMEDDLTVNAIHYDEVSNLGGGKTATIGSV